MEEESKCWTHIVLTFSHICFDVIMRQISLLIGLKTHRERKLVHWRVSTGYGASSCVLYSFLCSTNIKPLVPIIRPQIFTEQRFHVRDSGWHILVPEWTNQQPSTCDEDASFKHILHHSCDYLCVWVHVRLVQLRPWTLVKSFNKLKLFSAFQQASLKTVLLAL